MNILIEGVNFVNKGGEAMLRTVQKELMRRIPNSSFYLFTSRAETELALSAGIHPIVPEGRNRLRKLLLLILKIFTDYSFFRAVQTYPKHCVNMLKASSFDACIDISGFRYSDEFDGQDARCTCAVVNYFSSKRRPYIFLPQAWGPFNQPKLASYTKECCGKASEFYARDKQSQSYLQKLLGVEKRRIKVSPDIAFRFQAAEQEVGVEILASHGIARTDAPIIALTPNMQVYKRTPGEDRNNSYVRLLIDIARHCITELKTTVVLVPHYIYTRSEQNDDRYLCRIIKDALDPKHPVAALTTSYSAEALKSVIAQMDLLIGSRFHSIVAALSCRIPVVVIGWAHKYQELLNDVGLRGYAIGHSKLRTERTIRLISKAWTFRHQSKQILDVRIPEIEKEVDAVFDYVADIITRSKK